ncbi:hypothetical protein [Verrucomicrobium spinosum]|uniref:hypothetical protein n=1 Tax=Verrucomicrobium spinosum TaxID=2736 RepID=UPI00094666FE|nr:hypothetical protein [Verrucomicrobium spinosum]
MKVTGKDEVNASLVERAEEGRPFVDQVPTGAWGGAAGGWWTTSTLSASGVASRYCWRRRMSWPADSRPRDQST